jgi:kynurenine 3-monooxygenase
MCVCATGNLIGLVLYKVGDEEVNNLSSEEETAAFLQKEFPALYPIIPRSEVTAFAKRPPGSLPFFKYVGPDLHYSDSAVLLGDVVHTVKPYFGLGVNSALEDVAVLRDKLEACPVCQHLFHVLR